MKTNKRIASILALAAILAFTACSKKQSPAPEGETTNPGTNPGTTAPEVITPVSFERTELMSALSERTRLQQNMQAMDFTPTGLYAPPFVTIKVNVELLAGTRAPILLFGTYSRYGTSGSQPAPVQLKAGVNEFTSPGQGLIWIRYTNDNPNSKAKLTFTAGFKKAAYYISGKQLNRNG